MSKKKKTEKKTRNSTTPKYTEMKGITGEGIDYAVYHMNFQERLTGALIGFVLGFAMVHIFFMNTVFSVVVGVGFAFLAQPIYQNWLLKRRADRMRVQFRDFLEALASSYSAGQTALGGFGDAKEDMDASHGEDCEFAQELRIILRGMESNYRLDDLLEDFAKRSHMEYLQNFVDTYNVCYRMGGDVRKVVNETKQMINDQMEIEMEIETGITENKNSINIIAIMPFLIVALLRATGNEAIVGNSAVNVIVKLIALAIFIGSYLWGKKIMDIRF